MQETRRAIMFANIRSGSARRSFFRSLTSLRAAGIDVTDVRFDLSRTSIVESVRDARARGTSLVIAFGGDGTVGSVVEAILGQDVILGVIPAGTSNNFLRSLDVPRTIPAAVGVIARGAPRRIDVGEVNGRYFAHAAIMGLNVDFARVSQRLRLLLGRLSYPVASLVVYFRRRRLSVHMEAEGTRRSLHAFQVTVIPSSRLQHRTGLAESDGVRLTVLCIDDLRLGSVLRMLPAIFFGRHLGMPGRPVVEVSEARIDVAYPEAITLDGEIKAQSPAAVRILPGAVRVMAPQGATT